MQGFGVRLEIVNCKKINSDVVGVEARKSHIFFKIISKTFKNKFITYKIKKCIYSQAFMIINSN